MTAQISNSFFLKDQEMTIVSTDEILFVHPMHFNIQTTYRCTACVDGYYCKYGLKENTLVLKEMYICAAEDDPKPIGDVYPEESNSLIASHVYRELDLPMAEFSGSILLGDDFQSNYYVHMGYQSFWAYATLWELTFEKGQLIRAEDHSKTAEAVRQYLTDNGQYFLDMGNEALLEALGVAKWW